MCFLHCLFVCAVCRCSRLVTSDKTSCDVCSSEREAIRTAAPAPAAAAGDLASLFGSALIGKGGVPVSADSLRGKVVALYFSAHVRRTHDCWEQTLYTTTSVACSPALLIDCVCR